MIRKIYCVIIITVLNTVYVHGNDPLLDLTARRLADIIVKYGPKSPIVINYINQLKPIIDNKETAMSSESISELIRINSDMQLSIQNNK